MADPVNDPLIQALANPEFLTALHNLVGGGAPVDLRIADLEARYGSRPGEPPPAQTRPAGELGELLGRVLAAQAGDRHNPLTSLALYFAHRLRSLDELQTTVLGFLQGRPYADMLDGSPSEFEQITRTAWEKSRAWKAKQAPQDIEDRIEGRGRQDQRPLGDDLERALGEPPRWFDGEQLPPSIEHHIWPICQSYVSNILAGPGGSNKTAVAILFAVATAAERPDLLWEPEEAAEADEPLTMEKGGPVLIIDLDGQPGAVEARLNATLALHNLKFENLRHPIAIYQPRKQGNLFYLVERSSENWFKVVQGEQLIKLGHWIKDGGIKFSLMILDTFGRAHPFAMVEDTAAREAIAAADRFADVFSTSLLVISHTAADVSDSDDLGIRKRKGVSAGSTALENTARSNSGMLPMGEKDAASRGVTDDRRRRLLGVTIRKANDAPEGQWYWFERHIVPVKGKQRDGRLRVTNVPALKRAYHIGEIIAPAQVLKIDEKEANRRFTAFLVQVLQGQGRLSLTALADRYLSLTPHNLRVASARSTVRERVNFLAAMVRVDLGKDGVWFIHSEQVTVKRREFWTDQQEPML